MPKQLSPSVVPTPAPTTTPVPAAPGVQPAGNAAAQASVMSKLGKAGGAASGAYSMVKGAQQVGVGAAEWNTGERVKGGLDMAAGSGSMVSGAAGLHGLATGTGAALGTAVGAAGAVPVLGAAAGGLATGIGIGNRGNRYAAESGLLGEGRDWSTTAADVGLAARERWGDAAGLAATGLASIPAAAGAAVTGVAGYAEDAVALGKRLVGG